MHAPHDKIYWYFHFRSTSILYIIFQEMSICNVQYHKKCICIQWDGQIESVKSCYFRIMFIHNIFLYTVMLHAVLQQLPARIFSVFLRQKEKHYQPLSSSGVVLSCTSYILIADSFLFALRVCKFPQSMKLLWQYRTKSVWRLCAVLPYKNKSRLCGQR